MFSQGREVGNPVVHVVAGAGLVGPPWPVPVVGDHPVAVAKKKVICSSRPPIVQPWLKRSADLIPNPCRRCSRLPVVVIVAIVQFLSITAG